MNAFAISRATTTTALAFVVTAAICASPAAAQPQADISAQQEAMSALSFMVGTWEGEGEMRRGPQAESSQVLEKVAMKLNNTALLIEGLGTRTLENGEIETTHEAIGLIWYDPASSSYRMKALTAGRETDAIFELTETGIVWGFSTPGGEVRYTATYTDDTWTESGEFSSDGENWMPFFSMNLVRVADAEEPSS